MSHPRPINRRHIIAVGALLLGAVLLAACGGGSSGQSSSSGAGAAPATDASPPGDIPDTQAFVAFTSPEHGFTMKVPEGWAQTQDGTATVFADKFNSIRVETTPTATAPTAASVSATVVPALRASVPGFVAGKVSTVQRSAGTTVVVTYRGDSNANAVTHKRIALDFERYLYWKNGTEATVTLAAPVGSDNVDPWRTITNSFAWTG
jgi:hypothetical protein